MKNLLTIAGALLISATVSAQSYKRCETLEFAELQSLSDDELHKLRMGYVASIGTQTSGPTVLEDMRTCLREIERVKRVIDKRRNS